MAKLTDARVATLQGYFNTGDQPSEAQFANLISWIQQGIEEHQHDGTGDGDSSVALTGVLMADDSWQGIGAALERFVFDGSGDICVMGARLGVGLLDPAYEFVVSGSASPVLQIKATDSTGASLIYFGDQVGAAPGRIQYHHVTDELSFWTSGAKQGLFDSGGRFGVNIAACLGQAHIDQSVEDAAIPVLVLDQADNSEGFINFVGNSAASAVGPISTWTTGGAHTGFVRVEINGAAYWMPFYTAPTS